MEDCLRALCDCVECWEVYFRYFVFSLFMFVEYYLDVMLFFKYLFVEFMGVLGSATIFTISLYDYLFTPPNVVSFCQKFFQVEKQKEVVTILIAGLTVYLA